MPWTYGLFFFHFFSEELFLKRRLTCSFFLFVLHSLAYAELYITIANFVRRFDMDLYETTIENIRSVREYGLGYPKDGSFSVRAKITNVVKE